MKRQNTNSGYILYAHKPCFLMPGHIYRKSYGIWWWDVIIMFTSCQTNNQSICSLLYKYAITPVVYYNTQFILLSFPINTEVFELKDFWLELSSAHQRTTLHFSCIINTYDLPDMYALRLWPLGFRCTYQANHLCPCYYYYWT